MRNLLRASGIVLLGVVVWGLVWNLANLGAAALWPDELDLTSGAAVDAPLPLLTLLVLSVPLSIAVGALAARLAGPEPQRTVRALAAVQLLIGIAVQASVWELMPIWFHVPFLVAVVPATLFGGWLVRTRTAHPAS